MCIPRALNWIHFTHTDMPQSGRDSNGASVTHTNSNMPQPRKWLTPCWEIEPTSQILYEPKQFLDPQNEGPFLLAFILHLHFTLRSFAKNERKWENSDSNEKKKKLTPAHSPTRWCWKIMFSLQPPSPTHVHLFLTTRLSCKLFFFPHSIYCTAGSYTARTHPTAARSTCKQLRLCSKSNSNENDEHKSVMLNIYEAHLSHYTYSLCINSAFTHAMIHARICAQVYRIKVDRSLQPPPTQTQSVSSVVSPLLIGNLARMLTCYWLLYCVTSFQHFAIGARLSGSQLHIQSNPIQFTLQFSPSCKLYNPPTNYSYNLTTSQTKRIPCEILCIWVFSLTHGTVRVKSN